VTLDSDKRNHHDFGHPPVRVNNSAPPSPTTLDSVCRSVTELARAAPKPPRRIKLQHGQTTVEVEWPDPETAATATPTTAPQLPSGRAPSHQPPPGQSDSAQEQRDELRYVRAPTVGTFYHSPEPGAPPFVSVGDLVRPGQTIGILEVMKMMSPVQADSSGRIIEFLAPDAQSVEYQEPLIAITPTPHAQE
jgi:acetyl-CoA carboxylase biotin carboxyl carrier protein